MSGSSTLPSTAVLAMVEPDSDENTVPPITETTDSRPGRRTMSRSTASMALKAMPVWNRISPMSRNRGIGARAKLVSASMLLRTICASPASPPRNTQAPTMLTPRKANATGSPSAISRHSRPSMRARAAGHSMAQGAVAVAEGAGGRSPCRARTSRRANSMASRLAQRGINTSRRHSGTTSSFTTRASRRWESRVTAAP